MSVPNGAFTRDNGFGGNQTRNYPRFHVETVEDIVASEREGRKIFRDEERVEIIMPGNPNTRPVMKITEEHKQMWPQEYEQFKKGHEVSINGTPLEAWPRLRPANVLELKHLGFQTVEQVAAMDDLAIQRVGMGGRNLKNLAMAFIDDAEANALAERLTAENNRQTAENAELRHKVEELSTLLNSIHAEMQTMKNAPSPLLTNIPGLSDPVELAKRPPAETAGSSLNNMTSPEPRRRGRPPGSKNVAAA